MGTRTLEQQKALSEAANSLADAFVVKNPQADEDGTLNYVFCGSFALLMLAGRDSIDELDSAALPAVRQGKTRELSPLFHREFQHHARRISDLDVLVMPAWCRPQFSPSQIYHLGSVFRYAPSSGVVYYIQGVDAKLIRMLGIRETPLGVECDSIQYGFLPRAVALSDMGRQICIQDPRDIFAHTLLSMLESDFKQAQRNEDCRILSSSLAQVYSRDDLASSAYNVLNQSIGSERQYMYVSIRSRLSQALDTLLQ